jgi:hypothetical protein
MFCWQALARSRWIGQVYSPNLDACTFMLQAESLSSHSRGCLPTRDSLQIYFLTMQTCKGMCHRYKDEYC